MEGIASAERILICLRYGIGDLVMETPALEALRQHLPHTWIVALGAQPALDLLMRDSRVNRLCSIHDFGIRHSGDDGDPQIRANFKDWLKRERFDAVLDPSHAAFGPRRVIWECCESVFDARDECPDDVVVHGGSGVDAIKGAVLRGWGLRVPQNFRPSLHIGMQDRHWAKTFLNLRFPKPKPLIALSPAASSSTKAWPMERMVRLGRRLMEKGFHLLILYGNGDSQRLAGLFDFGQTNRVALARGAHLLRAAALLSHCRAVVCNDTGIMHVAAAVNTPVVGLFGPTEPSIYLPRQTGSVALRGNDGPCRYRETRGIRPSPCQTANHCVLGREESCICGIQVEEVFSALKKIVGKERRLSASRHMEKPEDIRGSGAKRRRADSGQNSLITQSDSGPL